MGPARKAMGSRQRKDSSASQNLNGSDEELSPRMPVVPLVLDDGTMEVDAESEAMDDMAEGYERRRGGGSRTLFHAQRGDDDTV